MCGQTRQEAGDGRTDFKTSDTMVDLWEDHSPLHTWKANTSFGPVLGGAEGHHSCPFFGSAASRKGPSSPSEGRALSAS